MDHAHHRLARLHRKLGSDYDGPDRIPPQRPKWMRQRTYDRVVQQIEAGEDRLDVVFTLGAQRKPTNLALSRYSSGDPCLRLSNHLRGISHLARELTRPPRCAARCGHRGRQESAVVHRAHRIELKGPILRKRHSVDAPARTATSIDWPACSDRGPLQRRHASRRPPAEPCCRAYDLPAERISDRGCPDQAGARLLVHEHVGRYSRAGA